MEARSLIFEIGLALPVILGLTLFILLRSERKPVHLMMATLIAWLAGLALRNDSLGPS